MQKTDISKSHNDNIRVELKEEKKHWMGPTMVDSIDKIHYEGITAMNLHTHKIQEQKYCK